MNPTTARITVLRGDGVGPEVVDQACKVLQQAAAAMAVSFEFTQGLIGGSAIDQTGGPLPEETIALCRESDAVLLGAVGGPKWDNPQATVRPEQGLLGIRKALGLFANLRPVRIHPALVQAGPLRPDRLQGVDMLIVRELTGGIYFGQRNRTAHASGEQAFDTMIYNTEEIARVVRVAGRLARRRRGRVTSIDKANVLEVSRLWRATAERVLAEEFADIEQEHLLVDAAAMHLIQNPGRFDVIVTGNLFGDILTDEASVLAGSMGLLPSASVGNSGPGLYEPIHGSAPDIAGRSIANPIGMILSTAMMCRESLNLEPVAACIEASVERVIARGARTADLIDRSGDGDSHAGKPVILSTDEMGDAIAREVAQQAGETVAA